MRKFKCIKNYPNGPDIETVVEYYNNWGMYGINSLCLYNREDIENYPEFWEEIVEKDYEILEYKSIQGLHCEKGQYCFDVVSQYGNPNEWFIYKIRRKSDGVEFKIGDKVYWNWQYSPQKYYTIEGFSINKEDNSLDFYTKGSCKYSWIFNKIQHYKEPILITEDGYEMYEGDKVYFVEIGEYLHKGCEIVNSYKYNYILDKDFKFFKTKENAEKYIYENKPEFSRKQILDAIEYAKYAEFSKGIWVLALKIKVIN